MFWQRAGDAMANDPKRPPAQRLSWEQLETILDGLVEGFVAFDQFREVIWLNRAACQILGVDRQQAARVSCGELFDGRSHGPLRRSPSSQASATTGRQTESSSSSAAGPREVLCRELAANNWNVSKTARQLKLSRTALYQQMARYGLQRPADTAPHDKPAG